MIQRQVNLRSKIAKYSRVHAANKVPPNALLAKLTSYLLNPIIAHLLSNYSLLICATVEYPTHLTHCQLMFLKDHTVFTNIQTQTDIFDPRSRYNQFIQKVDFCVWAILHVIRFTFLKFAPEICKFERV
jgi:hypothetical protein